MSGRGRGGWGRGGFGRGAQLPSEKFPEIEDLGKAQYSESNKQSIMLSMDLQKFWKASPYYYEPAKKVVKTDIERYSDRQQRVMNKKRPLEHYIFMDADHLPGELAKAGGARVAKNVQWDIEFDDAFKKLEEKAKGKENEARMMRKAEEEDTEDDDDSGVEDDSEEELKDDEDDDYIARELVDDDEDDYNDYQDDGNIDDTY